MNDLPHFYDAGHEAPVQAKVWELERLRCNLCGGGNHRRGTARSRSGKNDASAGAIIALLKYGSGFPFHRLQQLQENFGIPLPASTQWDIVAEIALRFQPVFEELRRQAANGKLLHNDDTSVRILELMKENAQRETQGDLDELVDEYDTNNKNKQRTGIFTTAVVSVVKGKKIAIFNTGREHAGESLAGVLKRRTEAEIPLQMSDAL